MLYISPPQLARFHGTQQWGHPRQSCLKGSVNVVGLVLDQLHLALDHALEAHPMIDTNEPQGDVAGGPGKHFASNATNLLNKIGQFKYSVIGLT